MRIGREEKQRYSNALHQLIAWEIFLNTKALKKVNTLSILTNLHDRLLGTQSNFAPTRSDSAQNHEETGHFGTVFNAMDVCKAIIFYSANMRYHQGKTMNGIRVISLLFALAPFYVHSNYGNYDMTAATIAFRFFAAIITFVHLNLLLLIFYVAIFDMARQYRISRILHKMIRVTHLELNAAVEFGDFGEGSDTYSSLFSKANSASCDIPAIGHIVQDIKNPLNSNNNNDSNPNNTASTAPRNLAVDSMISAQDRIKVSKSMPIPRIDLDNADNVYTWLYARLVLHNFGYRVRYRINMFVACILFFTLVLMLVILNKVIRSSQLGNAGNADDDGVFTTLIADVNFVQSMIVTAVFIAFTFLLIYFGSIVNEEFSLHRRAISSYVVRNRSRLYIGKSRNTLSKQEEEDLEEAVEALVIAQEAIEINNETNPYKIVGVEPEGGVMASLATVVAGFYSVILNLVFPSDSSGLDSI